MKKGIITTIIASALITGSFTAVSAQETSYTFDGFTKATKGNTEDVQNASLTKDITVTTSGKMNYKNAAVTDLEHNKELGTYPINDTFKADGSYIYLGTASTNNDTVFTLNVPKIKKGSRVQITYAKPVVTNNGSTKRNANDPYAYFEIGGRYFSINGGDFDKWRTDYIVTAEDTDKIIFHADKWGAVAIEKIEISDENDTPLHSINIHTEHYANVTINGIKIYADENGNVSSYIENGKDVIVKSEKDGYTANEQNLKITADNNINLPLSCNVKSEYYESDFGTENGELILDGNFAFDKSYSTHDVTDIFGNVTFTENGSLSLFSADDNSQSPLKLEYNNGIYLNGTFITSKDNMEFHAVIDKKIGAIVLTQNGKQISVPLNGNVDTYSISGVSGNNAAIASIGIAYPAEPFVININGEDCISSSMTSNYSVDFSYKRPASEVKFTVSGLQNAYMDGDTLVTDSSCEGTAVITAEYEGVQTQKQVKVVSAPKIKSAVHDEQTLNLHDASVFELSNCIGEYGNKINPVLKDFKSSDNSVITIDENGKMYAVGKGKATITVNAYTGTDNIFSFDYTVDDYSISGVTSDKTVYVENPFTAENIIGYKIHYSDGTSEDITPTDIPAAVIEKDGNIIINSYTSDGKLKYSERRKVKAGNKIPISYGGTKIYTEDNLCAVTPDKAVASINGFAIEHTAGLDFEIDPVYRFDNVGDVKDDGKTFDALFENGFYNMTFKKAETFRGDIFVNGYMVGNNVDQADADRKVTDGALYTAEDIKIKQGTFNVSMTDGSTMLDYVTLTKQPDFYKRPMRVYVIGDSLACIYYGSIAQEVGGGRSGWGQHLPNYLNVPVTDLANSGQYASGLYATAFPSIPENGVKGDILLLECAYNDRNYSTREEMTSCVKDMITQCRNAGITPILITPNASKHDYKPSVAWSSYLKDIAEDMDCQYIDLSKLSYDFLYSLYGDDSDNVVTLNYNLTAVGGDTLHSSYAAAHKWASIIASELKRLGYSNIVNNDYEYSFTDTLGNKIIAKAE